MGEGSILTSRAVKQAAATVLFLVFVSAIWVETDAYRFVAIPMLLWAVLAHSRSPFKNSIGWMGYGCIAWAAYVALRYLAIYLWGGTQTLGASEGIYLFPALCSTIAFLLLCYRQVLPSTALLFVLISFVMALATVDLVGSFDGDFHDFFLTNNRIHGSIGGGFVILAAINVAAFAGRTIQDRSRWLIEATAYATVILCVIGLFGSKSKGVWVAIAIALAVNMLLSMRDANGRRAITTGAFLLAGLAIFVALFHEALWKTLAPSLDGLTLLLLNTLASEHPAATVREAIACGGLPRGTYLRLMMWYNALEVWSHNILLGNGIGWKDIYNRSFYAGIGFDVVHNGYLEIAMRYGVLGLAFYATLHGWTVAMARRALRFGLISPEAYRFHVTALVFFAVTIVTNSNNRLAVGEAYMIAAAAFGFYCMYLCQYREQEAERAAATTVHA